MLAGHYSASFAAKTLAPRLPWWAVLLAAQAVDIVLDVLLLFGIERVSLDFSLPSNPLVIEYVPFTHSLLGNAGWAVLAYFVTMRCLQNRRAAFIVSLTVLSHWFLDVIIHRPDMTLHGAEPRLGTSLWNYPALANGLELSLLVLGLLGYLAVARPTRREARAAWLLTLLLVATQVYAIVAPPPPTTTAMAVSLFASYLSAAGIAAWLERRARAADQRDGLAL